LRSNPGYRSRSPNKREPGSDGDGDNQESQDVADGLGQPDSNRVTEEEEMEQEDDEEPKEEGQMQNGEEVAFKTAALALDGDLQGMVDLLFRRFGSKCAHTMVAPALKRGHYELVLRMALMGISIPMATAEAIRDNPKMRFFFGDVAMLQEENNLEVDLARGMLLILVKEKSEQLLELAKVLLKCKGSALATSRCQFSGKTPLHEAVYHKNQPIARLLLTYKADPWASDVMGRTPLHVVANFEEFEPKSYLPWHCVGQTGGWQGQAGSQDS